MSAAALVKGLADAGIRPWLQGLCLVTFLYCAAMAPIINSGYLHPATVGSDISNYLAAGQRLDAGHPLYAISARDTPAPFGDPQFPWTFPILSPPPIAVLWRPLALLPGAVAVYAWWAAGFLSILGFLGWFLIRASTRPLALALPFMPGLAFTLWAGNVNAFLIPLAALVWITTTTDRPRWAGGITAFSAALKLTPALYAWWFVCRDDKKALSSAIIGGAVFVGISLLGAGLANHLAYLAVAQQASNIGLSLWSPVTVVEAVGVPRGAATLAPYAIAALACLGAFVTRRDPRLSFACCSVGVALGLPSVRFDTLGWFLVVLVPWSTNRELRPSIARREAS